MSRNIQKMTDAIGFVIYTYVSCGAEDSSVDIDRDFGARKYSLNVYLPIHSTSKTKWKMNYGFIR